MKAGITFWRVAAAAFAVCAFACATYDAPSPRATLIITGLGALEGKSVCAVNGVLLALAPGFDPTKADADWHTMGAGVSGGSVVLNVWRYDPDTCSIRPEPAGSNGAASGGWNVWIKVGGSWRAKGTATGTLTHGQTAAVFRKDLAVDHKNMTVSRKGFAGDYKTIAEDHE